MKSLISIWFGMIFLALFISQELYSQERILKDVWAGYEGWVGDPDTIRVKILPGCSASDSAAIINAINTWNNMDTDPKFKLVSSGEAEVTIQKDDNLKGKTGDTKHTFASPDQDLSTPHERTGAAVRFDSNNGVDVQQIVTHELGHCLGLMDVDDPAAVMRSAGYAGASSVPNKHDSTQVDQAFIQSASSYGLEDAVLPDHAILPGSVDQLVFSVDGLIPPGSWWGALCVVYPIDTDVYVEMVELDSVSQSLWVSVYVMPDHPNGHFYLLVKITIPERANPVYFLGKHYINAFPVPPVVFECPMDISMVDGLVLVSWEESCTYPFAGPLRSFLTVDSDAEHYCMEINPDGDYFLDLDPGDYTFSLHVDDYQVNSASSTQNFVLTGIDKPENNLPLKAWPNPFSSNCHVAVESQGLLQILDLNGKLIREAAGQNFHWTPSDEVKPGIYILKAVAGGKSYVKKVVYRPEGR